MLDYTIFIKASELYGRGGFIGFVNTSGLHDYVTPPSGRLKNRPEGGVTDSYDTIPNQTEMI